MKKYVYFFAAATGFFVALASAQLPRPPPSKPLLAFGDDRNWIVLQPITYLIGDTQDAIKVPAGFVTDLASIPEQLWGSPFFLTPTGQYSRAAIVHDYLYWSQKCTRDQADRLLIIAMKESAVGEIDESMIYEGVHWGGAKAWKDNDKEKKKGYPRILPADRRDPPDPNMNWPTYQKQLIAAGVKPIDQPDDGRYCHYGDSTDVPHTP